MIKRVCGHSSPYTFKPNERYGKQRLESFLAKKCPACTQAAIAALEAEQKATSKRRKAEEKAAAKAARQAATELTTNPPT